MTVLFAPTDITFDEVAGWLPEHTAPVFRSDIMPALYGAATEYVIDFPGMVAQSGIETNWGTFRRSDGTPGAVSVEFRNTCGLKVPNDRLVRTILQERHGILATSDHPLCHAMFPSWDTGAIAHAQHLRAYGDIPFDAPIVDPRWYLVIGKHKVRHWEDLSGRWAGPNYGTSIAGVRSRLMGEP